MEVRQKLTALESAPGFAAAKAIVDTLAERGYLTVVAGGAVRDALLGTVPHDIDLATAAPPGVVEASFARTVAVGRAFGTIRVVAGGHVVEVTTFRREGPYGDGRRPDFVEIGTLEEDAARRDFTVNALFYDPRRETVLDFVGGRGDLTQKKLTTVGRAVDRFAEDALRMLRAVRFVGQLGFELDAAAGDAIRALSGRTRGVSAERVRAECTRLLTTPFAGRALTVLAALPLGEIVWPELGAVGTDAFRSLPTFGDWRAAFATLAALAAVDPTPRLRAWKASQRDERTCVEIVRVAAAWRSGALTPAERLRAIASECGDPLKETLRALSPGRASGLDACESRLAGLGGRLPAALLNGKDLVAMGSPPGAALGRALARLYDEQLEGKISGRADALRRAREIISAV